MVIFVSAIIISMYGIGMYSFGRRDANKELEKIKKEDKRRIDELQRSLEFKLNGIMIKLNIEGIEKRQKEIERMGEL